ncbi:MAG: permease [Treponema sp.]|nr:permease [Treponema sp.]
MIEILRRELIYLWYYFSIQFEQIVWYWLFGMALGSLISVFGKEKIHALFVKMRDTKMGTFGIVPASLLGIASPLCMYGTIPIAASFAEKGMAEDWIAAFVMSSILLNPQLLFYSAALGLPALVIRFVSCFLCGIAAGICITLFYKKKPFFSFSKFENMASRDTDPNLVIRYLKNFGRNIKATGLYFLVGIILSSLFQRYVPQDAFAALFGNNKGFGILMAAAVGVPLYVCGGGTIPLLLTWMQSSMSLGSASAFMITGQAMKITNLGAVKIVLGVKHFLFYILFTVLFALLSGFAVDYFETVFFRGQQL